MTTDQGRARRRARIFLGFPMATFEDEAGLYGLTPEQDALVTECAAKIAKGEPWMDDDVRRRAALAHTDPTTEAIRAAVAEEREACAKRLDRMADDVPPPDGDPNSVFSTVHRTLATAAFAIRERSEAGRDGMNGAKVQGG